MPNSMRRHGRGQGPPLLRFTAADRVRLGVLRPLLERRVHILSARFWRHQLSLTPARALLADAASSERARRDHQTYLLSLAAGRDERRPPPPPCCVGAFGFHLALLEPIVDEACAGNAVQAEATLTSLEKRLFLDAERAFDLHTGSRVIALEDRCNELGETNRALARRCAQLESALEERYPTSPLRQDAGRIPSSSSKLRA